MMYLAYAIPAALLTLIVFLITRTLESMSISNNVTGLFSANSTTTISDKGAVKASPSVPAAQPAVLTTHTTNTTGSLTMTNVSHGITTGQRIDIYWAGGQCYGAIVGTVAGTVVPIASVSGGSALPASLTAVTIGIPVSAPFECTGNNMKALACAPGTQDGYFVFNNGSADVFAAYVLNGAVYTWFTGNGVTNPLAAAVPTVVWCSHDSVAGAVVVQAGGITA